MSLTPWLPTVRKIKDGETVEQAVVNPPIEQLTQRDQHLYEKFEEITGKSALISFGHSIHPDETLNSGELNIVYYKSDDALGTVAGLAKAITGFSSSSSSSMYFPKNSNFVIGLVKSVYSQTRTADVYTEGLCELSVDIDDSTYGLIQKVSGVVEPFSVGPYYLSTKQAGKITKDPSGIPVYVGYAISKRKFLIHTNVDEFSQFFINYRYHILDRVAGKPTLSSTTWTINEPDSNVLGWLPASSVTAIAPLGAIFYYNIPGISALANDSGLTDAEKTEASELRKILPPVPNNFVQLFSNGLLQRYFDEFDSGGVYSVNEYGIWWHTDQDGKQPWSSSYPSNISPSLWNSSIKATIANTRKNIFTSFSKFNPALRTQLVSSLKSFNATGVNKSSNFIKFYSQDDPTKESAVGDLLLSVEAPTNYYGYKAGFTTADINVLTDDFIYPSVRSADFTAGRSIAAVKYSKEKGAFEAVIIPTVSKITGSGGINVSETSPGIINLDYLNQGITGNVDSIEPINARLEFRGLTSFIKLPPPSNTPYGMIGKIILPKGYPSNKDLNLIFHMFGDQAATLSDNIAFQFEYTVVPSLRTTLDSDKSKVNIPTDYASLTPVTFSLNSGSYTAYTSVKITSTDLKIPAAKILEDSVVSFKILRVSPAANSYAGYVGIVGTYWELS